MKRSRFTEEQIIGVLKEAEAGAKAADLGRLKAKPNVPRPQAVDRRPRSYAPYINGQCQLAALSCEVGGLPPVAVEYSPTN